ncbi:unnamed protein product, partial [Meganyctiphanes norvegica]
MALMWLCARQNHPRPNNPLSCEFPCRHQRLAPLCPAFSHAARGVPPRGSLRSSPCWTKLHALITKTALTKASPPMLLVTFCSAYQHPNHSNQGIAMGSPTVITRFQGVKAYFPISACICSLPHVSKSGGPNLRSRNSLLSCALATTLVKVSVAGPVIEQRVSQEFTSGRSFVRSIRIALESPGHSEELGAICDRHGAYPMEVRERTAMPLWQERDENPHGGLDAAGKTTILYKLKLGEIIYNDELRDAALLVFANKQDLPNAMNALEVTDKLGLHNIRNRSWYIQATCATSGDGLYEGLDWLSNELKKK